MRGRPFGFIGLLCSVWIATRVGVIGLASHGTGPNVIASKATERPPEVTVQPASKPIAAAQPTLNGCCLATPFGRAAFADGKLLHGRPSGAVFSGMLLAEPFSTPLPARPIILPPPPAPHGSGKGAKPTRHLSIYAYSFWRSGAPAPSLLGNGQYGGGQSAVIAAYALPRFGRASFDIMARASIAHDNSEEREFAAGVRWRPTPRFPVQFTLERRFRHGRGDAFSAYAAGGTSDIGLPMGFKLDGYAQAGYVSGDAGGLFADVSARADRKLLQIENTVMSGGIGVWGGGQRDVMRVDIGPTVRADLALGQAQFRLAADWRFRVAGNAAPGNGPALTLSTSF
jgi:hypothetical protein